MITYCLQRLQKSNAASVIEWETNEDDEVLQVLVIPGFMDGILNFVRPVISLPQIAPIKGWGMYMNHF